MERIIVIRDEPLKLNPLHEDQHAYMTGKYTDSALHHLVTKIENKGPWGSPRKKMILY